MASVNAVVLTGNLTADPELHEGEGFVKAKLRLAVHNRRKRGEEWVEEPHFFDVICFGRQAQNCAEYLEKGRPVAVQGKLQYREWESDSGKRRTVEVLADQVQFLGSRSGESTATSSGGESPGPPAPSAASEGANTEAPIEGGDEVAEAQAEGEDGDIPF